MRCIDCQHYDLRSYPKYAALGMGKCRARSIDKATFMTAGFARECEKFEQADKQITEKRIQWLGVK